MNPPIVGIETHRPVRVPTANAVGRCFRLSFYTGIPHDILSLLGMGDRRRSLRLRKPCHAVMWSIHAEQELAVLDGGLIVYFE